MAFFEELGKKAQAVAGVAAEKAKDLAGVASEGYCDGGTGSQCFGFRQGQHGDHLRAA